MHDPPSENSDAPALIPLNGPVVDVLLESRRAFKNFLRSRLPGDAEAEDILQGSLIKALTRADSLWDPDRLVSWFYQILRHALTDFYRSRVAEVRKYEDWAGEFAQETPPEENNLSVRLHRARQALKTSLTRSCGACAEHACLDCTCRTPGGEKKVAAEV